MYLERVFDLDGQILQGSVKEIIINHQPSLQSSKFTETGENEICKIVSGPTLCYGSEEWII